MPPKEHHITADPLYPEHVLAHTLDKTDDEGPTAFGDKSPGVRRIEAITTCFTTWHRWVLFASIFLVAYSYGLDGTIRYTFQSTALSVLGTSAQVSTVTVVRSIVAAAAQPIYAKVSDYFGRISILIIAVVFYVIGSIVTATAKNLAAYCGGSMLYQFGYTGTQLLIEVLIADVTSLRSRLVFSYIPALPFLINAWVSGNIASAIIADSTWNWGIGMWAIIFPVTAVPLLVSLINAEWRAHKRGLLANIPSPFKSLSRVSLWVDIFWQIDVTGLLLLAAVLALILVPFTLAGGVTDTWQTAHIIAPLVIGFVVALPLFVLWELKWAKHPMVPFKILKDRQVLAPLIIAMFLNTAWYTQGDYLYYTLLVAFDRDVTSATRVSNVYSFTSVVIGVCLGLVVRYVRRLKYFIVAGTLLFVIAFGLLIRYRGGYSNADFAGLVAAEVILGIAGGLFPYPAQVMIQTAVQHEHTAVVTSLYLASYSVGSALGNTIAAAIWTNTMPTHLLNNLNSAGVSDAATLQALAYASPLTFIAEYAPGTTEREAVSSAYREVQRYLTITGICISVVLVGASLCLRNPVLGEEQSLPAAEDYGMSEARDNEGPREERKSAEAEAEAEANVEGHKHHHMV